MSCRCCCLLKRYNLVVRAGGEVVIVDDEWGTPVSIDKVEQALEQHPDTKILAFVHAETSTGAVSDAQALGYYTCQKCH